MNTRSAILFPDTVPTEQMLFPLVQVFDRLVYFQVVENDAVSPVLHSELCEEMVRESFCSITVPAPLGEDRERFLRLLSDLRTRRDDYAARLGHVALAGISSAGRREAESKTSILSRLLSGGGLAAADGDKAALLLWQARLVLKLGEMYDAEQEQLNAELWKIKEEEEHLLSRLRSEAEFPFALTRQISSVSPERKEMPMLRCRSWARIFALGPVRPDADNIFLSGDGDAVDSLLEQYEKRTGRRPERLMSCLLPARRSKGNNNLLQRIRRFRSESASLFGNLDELVDNLPAAVRAGSEAWTREKEDAWETLLARLYPSEINGRARLSLYACPDVLPRRLFIDAFADDREELLMPAFPGEGSGLVLGILRQL
jgi:hypothetical protein